MRDTGWFKSTRSGGANEDCVEVRITEDSVGVRDSKNQAGLSFAVPGSGIWYRMWIDGKDRLTRELILDPGHRIYRQFSYRGVG